MNIYFKRDNILKMEEEIPNIYICIIRHSKFYKVLECTMKCILNLHTCTSEEIEIIYVGLLDNNTIHPVHYSRQINLNIPNISDRGWFLIDYFTRINLLHIYGNIIENFTPSSLFVMNKKRCIKLNYQDLIESITKNILGIEGAPSSNSMKN